MTNIFDFIDSILEEPKAIAVAILLLFAFPMLSLFAKEPKTQKRKRKMSFEKKVGETIKWRDKEFVVTPSEGCEGCFFFNYEDCADLIFVTGPCCSRKDGVNVKFVELIKGEEDGKKEDNR